MSSDADIGGSSVPPQLCEYAVEVTAERLDRMLSHIDGVRSGKELAPVHQMRVWSRRTRAALEIFTVCFTGPEFANVVREVKAATDALSEARDLDVMVENLGDRAAKLAASERGGIESFVARLRDQRESKQHAVSAAVTNLESHHLAQRFRDLAQKAADARSAAAAEEQVRSELRIRRNRKGGRHRG